MPAPPHIARAARLAAQRVEAAIIEMMEAKQRGRVEVHIGFDDLQTVKHIEEIGKYIKVGRGQGTQIEVIGGG